MMTRFQYSLPVIAGGVYLWILQVRGEVWAVPAHVAYRAFLLLLIGLAVGLAVPWRRSFAAWMISAIVSAIWALLAIMLVVASYVPSGWVLGNRLILVFMVILLSAGLFKLQRQSHTHSPLVGFITVMVSLTLTVLLTYMIDRGVGLMDGGRKPGGLVFPRNSSASYQTTEFNYTAHINTYGFRGENMNMNVPVDCRVMLLGDSFTYGFGLSYEQTWGVLLERALRDMRIDAQVLNLGVPGGNPPDYAVIARQAAPILKPDVVLVGVLQGDDMRQMSRPASAFPRTLTFGETQIQSPLREFVAFHYPFIAERTVLSYVSARRIRQQWAATAADFIANHTDEQQQRYLALDEELRSLFEQGQMNPHFLQLAVISPDYWAWPLQDPATLTPYIAQMANEFAAIRANAEGAQVAVISVPYGAYTQESARQHLLRFGFILPPEIVESSLVDDAIEHAANQTGVEFLSVTSAFRDAARTAFYPIDGHFNPEGSQLFADTILPTVQTMCEQHIQTGDQHE